MYSLIICICVLVLGYTFYGRLVDKIYRPQPGRPTPAYTKGDGVDFVPMPTWKVFMIQFLNIAGTGPIFGAIMGAKFGPASYLWIVLGCIFAGAVHDYLTAMMSVRHEGAIVPQLTRHYVGKGGEAALNVLVLFLLLLVGVVFVYSPALIIGDMAPIFPEKTGSIMFWVCIIFLYYIFATLLPIDKLIGKIYPFFAISMLFMAVGLMICLFVKWPSIPEIWDGLQNLGPSVGVKGQNIFPCMFITIACGSISGFHATQSPLMVRCLKNEKDGKKVFYGAMITEGLVALIWATISSYFFFDGGKEAVGAIGTQAPEVVTSVSKAWLGTVGSILAIIGVVAAPITSGDTAFRSIRLIFAQFFKLDQKPIRNRIIIAIPIFVVAALLLWFNISDADGFNKIWRYFGFANQTLATCLLWMSSVWMLRHHRGWALLITLLPAIFMTNVIITYLCVDPTMLKLPGTWTPWIILITTAVCLFQAINLIRRYKNFRLPQE